MAWLPKFVSFLAFLSVTVVSGRRILDEAAVNPEADALPGIDLPTRAQLQSFVQSQPVQQVLASAAASLAPLAQPVRGPAQGPAGFMPFMPYPLPADPPVQQPQSFQQASDNVVQDGPLRGDQLVDDLTPTDPSQIRPPLDPAYLRIGGNPAPPLAALPPLPGTGPGASFAQQQGPNQPGPNRPVNMRSFVQESRNMPAGSLPAAGNAAQSFQQQEDNVIHDGPLAGGVLTDNDIHPTDPAAGGLDPRYLRFGPVPGPIGGPADTTTFAAERPQLPRPGNVQSWAEAPTALPPLPGPLELFPIPGAQASAAAQRTVSAPAPAPSNGYQRCWRNDQGVETCCYNDGNGNIGCKTSGGNTSQGTTTAGK